MPLSSQEPDGWTGVSESDWAGLHSRVGTLESSVRIVAAGHQQLVDQMAEITVSQHRSGTRLDKLSSDLAENTKLGQDIRSDIRAVHDVVITARTGGKFARWLAPTLVAGAVSFGMVKGWWADLTDWMAR